MGFRNQLLGTLRAIQPLLELPGVMVVGSQVPNLLEPGAASTLVVSRDVDIGVRVSAHAGIKKCLASAGAIRQSPDEPSVWLPVDRGLIEVNFVGIDPEILDVDETYLLDDPLLPMLVFGPLSLIAAAPPTSVEGIRLTLPRPAGLLIEKLVTERTGEKGDRDLLVALGLLLVIGGTDIEEAATVFARLPPELRGTVRSNLSVLSLMEGRPGMPDPVPHRKKVSGLIGRLEAAGEV
jgi:hypothetical protein